MKTKIALGIVAFSLLAMSFKLSIDKKGAIVQEVEGLQVFAYAKPVAKYDILGTVEINGIVKNEKGPHMVELLVEKGKKNHPSAEAVIIGSNFYIAEVIRFKE